MLIDQTCHPLPPIACHGKGERAWQETLDDPQTRRTPWVARDSSAAGAFSDLQTLAQIFCQKLAAAVSFSLLSLSSLSSLAREERNKGKQCGRLARVASTVEPEPFPTLAKPPARFATTHHPQIHAAVTGRSSVVEVA